MSSLTYSKVTYPTENLIHLGAKGSIWEVLQTLPTSNLAQPIFRGETKIFQIPSREPKLPVPKDLYSILQLSKILMKGR